MLPLVHPSGLYDSEGLLYVLVRQQGSSWHGVSLCLTGIDGVVHQTEGFLSLGQMLADASNCPGVFLAASSTWYC